MLVKHDRERDQDCVSVDKTSSAGKIGQFAVETAAVRGPGSFSCEMSFLLAGGYQSKGRHIVAK